MPVDAVVLLDDRLLVEELLVGLPTGRRQLRLYTTSCWYYCDCRAAVAGAGELREDIGLPDPRRAVPVMAEVARRHPHLNLFNLEATAAALDLRAEVWLSERAAEGLLPGVLETEGLPWRLVATA